LDTQFVYCRSFAIKALADWHDDAASAGGVRSITSGIEVTLQIRRARALPAPVLIVTLHDSDHIVQEAMEAGASGLALKAEAADRGGRGA